MGLVMPSAVLRAPRGEETKLEPLVSLGEGGVKAYDDGTGVSGLGGDGAGGGGGGGGGGRGHGVRASEVSALANELDGGWKVGRRELA